MAFTIRHTGGVVCLAMPNALADHLQLPPMVEKNTARLKTAYTVSIEAKRGVTTGISAADRVTTIRTTVEPGVGPGDLTRPGHVFPLRDRDHGVLERKGHTEAAVDLCRLAGLQPVGAISELMHDDGTMMRLPAILEFARNHGLKVGTIADLIAHRIRHETIVEHVTGERFNAAMAQTLRAKPAYEAYDEGRKALAEKRVDVAHARADQAIRLLPGEAHFHALKGDAYLLQKNYRAATQAYTEALSRNDGFFYYHLQRGLIAERERNDVAARADLENSIRLLPTGPAYNALGNIALRARHNEQAKQYFAAASGAQGEAGAAAMQSLLRLDLPDNPEKYLRKQAALDQGGMLVIVIGNPNQVPVTGIVIAVQYVDAAGRTRDFQRNLSGTLAAGQQTQVAAGLGPFQNANQYRVTITSARVAE